jgi:hypothetical protein
VERIRKSLYADPGYTVSIDGIDKQESDELLEVCDVRRRRAIRKQLLVRRGSRVELIVRAMRDNDLVLDLESVNVNGQRYAIQTEKKRVESQRDNSLIGSIVGAINGGQAQGRAVRIPRDSVLNFRIQTPLMVGITDRGVDRGGSHYHDYYKQDDDNHRRNQ